ncbi:hypothetical protein [Mucilaginibacter sp.]|uniref:hypothetical protein n=1 Tax=Mucilaginibacter sp. TaxID=1882438 RepID=UPI003D0FA5B3
MSEKISELVLRLKRETGQITTNPLLDGIDIQKLISFEETSKADGNYHKKLKNIAACLRDMDYLHNEKYNRAFDAYNELVVYELLRGRLETTFIAEVKNIKTPDYRLSFDEYHCYSDLKTIHFLNGNLNYIEIQEQSARSKIKFDKAIKKRDSPFITSDAITIAPFKKGNNGEHRNVQYIIQELIKKVRSLIKLDQVNYEGSEGICLIDTVNLSLPPFLEIGLPVHHGYVYEELNSGILWNAVFGEIGDPVWNWVEFSGLPNLDKKLMMNGILKEEAFSDLKAIAFIIGPEENKRIIGFHRSSETNDQTMEVLYRLCDFVNDETNSQYFKILEIRKENSITSGLTR